MRAEEAAPTPSPAPSPTSTGASTTLPPVIVTASRMEDNPQDVPEAVTVVTQDAIQRRQPQTPDTMLQEEPGVWAVNTAAQGSPIIRGQIGNSVLYLWDGIRINNGALFAGPNGYFNQIPLGAVDHMEVIRGSGSVQYGSDAIGGVINIITKQDDFTDQLEYGGSLYSSYDSNDNGATETFDVHVTDSKVAISAGLTRQDVGNYSGASGELSPTGFESTGSYLNLAVKPTDNQTVRLSFIENERDDVGNYAQSKLNLDGIPRIVDPYESRGILKLDDTLTDLSPWSSELKIYGYYQYYDQRRDRNVQSLEDLSTTSSYTDQNILGMGVQNTTEFDKVRLVYGVDYRAEDLGTSQNQTLLNFSTDSLSMNTPAGKTPDGTYDVAGLFETTEYRPIDSLLLSAGVRLENTYIHSNPTDLDVIPNAGYTVNDLQLDKSWQSATWKAGTVYNLTKTWDLAANISTAFRAPTYSDLFSAGAPVYSSKTASVPSPTLNPETSITYEAGPRYHDDKITGSLTPYWTQLHDIVETVTEGTVTIPGQGVYEATHNANSGEGFVSGIEANASYKFLPDWTLFGNATYTYGQDTTNNVPLRFIPPLFGTIGIRYNAPSGRWWVEATEVIVGKFTRPAPGDLLDAGFSTDPALGSPNTTTNPPLHSDFNLPGYALTNLRAGVKVWQRENREFDITLDLNNVFNASYREVYAQQEYEGPGFGAVLGARLTF